jgi:glutamyl-tRNA synthetase
MNLINPVRVRFAPSPTGHTHLGSGRTALYNYLLARQTGGQFILRIEDTDQKRFVPQAEEELVESLHWLGMRWDEGPDVGGPYGPYRQSERRDIYQTYVNMLIDSGQAYYCFCTADRLEKVRQEQHRQKQNPRYDGTCRRLSTEEAARRVVNGEKHVVRFRMPSEGSITVRDYIRGDITVENTSLDDTIIVRSDGLPVYHLAAMVDDHLMKITHVIRGLEWLSTFPLHVHLIHAFGWNEPVFVHLSVFLKPSGKGKMSKREKTNLVQGGYSIFVKDLADLGYISEGVINWTALMGWSYDDRTEFFVLKDLIEKFSLDKLNPAPAAINFAKLDYFNSVHIRNLEPADLAQRVKPYFIKAGYLVDDDKLQKMIPIIRERLVTLDDAISFGGFFFEDEISLDPQELIGKDMDASASAEILRQIYALIMTMSEFSKDTLEARIRSLVEERGLGVGQVFGILRMAVTGQKVSPPLIESMEIIGEDKVLQRIKNASMQLEELTQRKD